MAPFTEMGCLTVPIINASYADRLFRAFAERHPQAAAHSAWIDVGVDSQLGCVNLRVEIDAEHRATLPARFENLPVSHSEDHVVQTGVRDACRYAADHARMAFAKPPLRTWPGFPGSKLGLSGGPTQGALGCYLFSPKVQSYYAMSCQHVFPKQEVDAYGSGVVSWTHGREIALGTLAPRRASKYDFALIEMSKKPPANWLPTLGGMKRSAKDFDDVDVKKRPKVVMHGAESGLSYGEATRFKRSVRAHGPEGPMYMVIDPTHVGEHTHERHSLAFCRGGDSGSIVCLQHEGDIWPLGILCRESRKSGLLGRGMIQSLSAILSENTLQLR